MNILSAEDFEKLRDSGMLYVVEPECDGSYDSYLEIYGEEPVMAIDKGVSMSGDELCWAQPSISSETFGVAEKKYNLGNIKIRVKGPEHSRKLQEHLFGLGCMWLNGSTKIFCEDRLFLFVDSSGDITSSSREETYAASEALEYAFSDQEIGYKPILPEVSSGVPMPNVKVPREDELKVVFLGGREGGKSILGIRPKYIVNMLRMQEIIAGMSRYVSEGKKIPAEWFSELDDLNEVLKDEKS